MPKFGKESEGNLVTADPKLQKIFRVVIKHFDCKVTDGHRGKVAQDKAVADGFSKVKWPYGKHNKSPSEAVDVMPYPVDYSESKENIEKITLFAGFVLGVAAAMEIPLRWGHDWNKDNIPDKKGLVDRPHYELVT